MRDPSAIVVMPAANGGVPDFGFFKSGPQDETRFEKVDYPGWQRYAAEGFSAESLIAELAAQIMTAVPRGPIRIVGISIGGHFGYATALHLQALGREIAGFCAIDTFMISSIQPSAGWRGRALTRGWHLLSTGRAGDFFKFLRSKFWRALFRFAGGRLPGLLRRFAFLSRMSVFSAFDSMFEEELSLRLMIRGVAPWIASLDRDPVPLHAPTILLRALRTAGDDAAWRRRCPHIAIHDVPGQHDTLFEPDHIGDLRAAFLAATRDWR
jgi:pimeloyl-ACP methyl ester carboxylesterase